ncbi:MAG TPA: DNA alkylation repair protein [Kribbellaceae bacterium]|nr:DNA alkylation repair protein [Kribbellaceae bacterium]
MTDGVVELMAAVDAAADPVAAEALARYFQVKPGGYGEGDVFIGVKLSELRRLVKPYLRAGLPLDGLERVLASPVHEHRLTALVLLADRADHALKPRSKDPAELLAIHDVYLRNLTYVDNWDLVDGSAPAIVGGYLLDKPRDELYELVASSNLWARRAALVATLRFIVEGQTADTYRLAELVLGDREDLIHKASGWMLREAGKRVDTTELLTFLDEHAPRMPRTMLRYAIERLPDDLRRAYLRKPG